MIAERLKEIEDKTLAHGSHKNLEAGACIMELVSYVAGEPWSDHPQCTCPILIEYAIRLNDRFSDEHRQALKPMIALLIGTRSTPEIQIARKRLIRWRHVTMTYPLILEALKLPKLAEEIRTFENTIESMAKAREWLAAKRGEILAADANANAYADTDTDAYAYANANADANAYADADAYAYADTDTDAYAYAYANADANAYADTDAYADADALRAKIVAVSVETLRLATEVKA